MCEKLNFKEVSDVKERIPFDQRYPSPRDVKLTNDWEAKHYCKVV